MDAEELERMRAYLEGVLGRKRREAPPEKSQVQQLQEVVLELVSETGESPPDAIMRALGTYRSILRHARLGGRVKFISPDGSSEKTLKVPLRK